MLIYLRKYTRTLSSSANKSSEHLAQAKMHRFTSSNIGSMWARFLTDIFAFSFDKLWAYGKGDASLEHISFSKIPSEIRATKLTSDDDLKTFVENFVNIFLIC